MVINIYKEKDWTSFDVVAKVRGILKKKSGCKVKVGHAGTLDPLAEGVLLILTDEDTKRQPEFMAMEKEYECEISFGAISPTYDLEGELTYFDIPEDLDVEKELEKLFPKYTGDIEQKVPPYSAVKVGGKPLYKKARQGKISTDQLPRKKITIRNIEKLDFYLKNKLPTVKLHINCGKGTYIRSLAHDLGEELGIGGVLIELTRTKVGKYTSREAIKISALEKKLKM